MTFEEAEKVLGIGSGATGNEESVAQGEEPTRVDDAERRDEAAQLRRAFAARRLMDADTDTMSEPEMAGLFRASTKALFGVEDQTGAFCFGKRAGDMRSNIESLRRFVKGDYSAIETEEETEWRKLQESGADEEALYRFADERLKGGAKTRMDFKGEAAGGRGPGFWETLVANAGAGLSGQRFGGVPQQGTDAALAETRRRSDYETLSDEEKETWRTNTIAEYRRQLADASPLSAFLKMTGGLSDAGTYLVANAVQTGEIDGKAFQELKDADPDEAERVCAAVSVVRGRQKSGRVLFVPTDFTDDTVLNRAQMNLYGFQQSLIGLIADTWDVAKSGAKWAWMKTALDDGEYAAWKKEWDTERQVEVALKQGLPDADGFWGAATQGLAENAHWFIPYGLIGKGKAAKGAVEVLKGQQKAAELATFTTEALLNNAFAVRDAAAVAKYTQKLRWLGEAASKLEKALPAAERAAGLTRWGGAATAGRAMAFGAFAEEYLDNADAQGISRTESVPTAAIVGTVNAMVENLYVPGLETWRSPAEIKALMWSSAVNAWKSKAGAGLRKWIGNRFATGTADFARVASSETLEEVLQQWNTQIGTELDSRAQKLRERGEGGKADALLSMWRDMNAEPGRTFANAWASMVDTVAETLPSSVGFGLTTQGTMKLRQHVGNAWQRYVTGDDSYDAGVVDMVQRELDARRAVNDFWTAQDDEAARRGEKPQERAPDAAVVAMSAAREALRSLPVGGDATKAVMDATGVDFRTAEVMRDVIDAETEYMLYSPTFRQYVNLSDYMVSLDEARVKEFLPGYVEGSFRADPEKGLFSAEFSVGEGGVKRIVYRYGASEDLVGEITDEMIADGSELASSYEERRMESGDGSMKPWSELDESERRAEARRRINGFLGGGGVFQFRTSDGKTVSVEADAVVNLVTGNLGDIGYGGPRATAATARHETFHALWRFAKETMAREDVAALYSHFPQIDQKKDEANGGVELDEAMAHEFEKYASGEYVGPQMTGWAEKTTGWLMDRVGGLIDALHIGRADNVANDYTLKGFYEKVLAGKLGTGALGVETRAVSPESGTGDAAKAPRMNAAPEAGGKKETATNADSVQPTPGSTTEKAAEAGKTAEGEAAKAAPSEAATLENPAASNVPGQKFYRLQAGDGVWIVGELVVSDVDDLKTSDKGNLSDASLQNRMSGKEREGRINQIAARPNPRLMGTVNEQANGGFIWAMPNGDVFIGNTRTTGATEAYLRGTADELREYMIHDADMRGIKIPEGVTKPLVHFVLRRIESADGKATIQDVVRMTNESTTTEMTSLEKAKNDADVVEKENLAGAFAFRPDGRIDETKSGDAIGRFRQATRAVGLVGDASGMLTKEGQERLQAALLAHFLKGADAATVEKAIGQTEALDMENEMRALVREASTLETLANVKPRFDLRDAIAEILPYYMEWLEKDAAKRAESGKGRGESAKRARRSWEAFMSQGDMFRQPSEAARIVGDLLAASRELRSFDKEDAESDAGKQRSQRFVMDYLDAYAANATAASDETDMFGTLPATREDLMRHHRANGQNGPRFSLDMRETLDPAAWGDLSRKVKVVGDGKEPISFVSGARVKDIKGILYDAAVENFKRQPNYREIDGRHFLEIDGSLIEVTKSGINHGLDRRYKWNGYASALLGDILNNSVEVPNVESPMHYRLGKMDVGRSCYVLVTTKDADGVGTVQSVEVLYSINAKADSTAQGFIPTNAIRSTEEIISNIRDAWQGRFMPNLVRHNLDSILKDKNAPLARQHEAVVEKYRGTPQWMKAPNGQPTKLTERQWIQVRTPSFKAWFGDWEKDAKNASQVVDEKGEPLVVYRGAPFDPLAQKPGDGVIKPEAYFTADPEYAKRYTSGTGKVRAYYLRIKYPFDIRNPECLADLKKVYPDREFQRGKTGALDWAEASIIDREFLEDNFGGKYDGIIYDEGGDPGEDGVSYRGVSYVPLRGAAQVKSATDNNGDFNPANHDVRYSIAAEERDAVMRLYPERGDIYHEGWVLPDGDIRRVKPWEKNHLAVGAAFGMGEGSVEGEAVALGKGLVRATFAGGEHLLSVGARLTPDAEEVVREIIADSADWEKPVTIDFYRNGKFSDSVTYDPGVAASKVISDIAAKTDAGTDGGGEVASPSELADAMRRRYSISGIYTGSAADYANRSREGGKDDGPTLVKIGTGEGSQVYGWGLYGSTVRGVAEGYARGDVFAKKNPRRAGHFEINGKRLPEWVSDRILEFDEFGSTYFDGRKPDAEFLIEALKDKGVTYGHEDAGRILKQVEENRDGLRFVSETEGNVYEQTFFTDRAPGDESHLLKWYEPVSEETWDIIREAERANGTLYNDNGTMLGLNQGYVLERDGKPSYPKVTGQSLYETLAKELGSPRAASEFLARAGIDGVKYPVDSFGGKAVKDGDVAGWNYVSFRDDNIRVDHKWTDGQMRYSVSVGDDLADEGRFADFKTALSQAQPIPDGVDLLPHDVGPKDALAYYDEHILGKTFTFPDGSTITMNPGHFFRLTCEGKRNKDGVRKGHVDGYADSASALEGIRKGEVSAERIYGWQSDRAGVMPLFGDLVEHPMFILQDKDAPEKTQNVKRYDLGDGRSIVAIFRVIDDGRRIISFSGFTPKKNKMKQYRVAYADDATRAGTSPARLEDGRAAQAGDIVSNSSGAAQGVGRWSVEAPRRAASPYPSLATMNDEELVAAALAARMVAGSRESLDKAPTTANTYGGLSRSTVEGYLRRVKPGASNNEIALLLDTTARRARDMARAMREDLDRGVSESAVVRNLDGIMRDAFGAEMGAQTNRGRRFGRFGAKAEDALADRQAKIVADAVRNQTGIELEVMENATGVNLAESVADILENELNRPPRSAGGQEEIDNWSDPSAGVEDAGSGEGAAPGEQDVSAKVKAAVDELLALTGKKAEEDAAKRKQRKEAAEKRKAEDAALLGDEGEDAGGGFAEGGDVAAAIRKAKVELRNPRHLALFVVEFARRYWNKQHGRAADFDPWGSAVAVQFLRKTAQDVYGKLVHTITYSRSRETSMRRVESFANIPTVGRLVNEMEYVGALVNARRIRESAQSMCEKLREILEQKFGATGRFKPDNEELRRRVPAELELRARYMKHIMWLTPDGCSKEAEELAKELAAARSEFDEAGSDVEQSRVYAEVMRKIAMLREFGGLRYKRLSEIEAAVQWWLDAAEGGAREICDQWTDREERTSRLAGVLAAAFRNPKLKHAVERSVSRTFGDYVHAHMGFTHLLRDLMRFAGDKERAEAERVVGWLELEIQKAGTRAMSERQRMGEAFKSAVESIYGRKFGDVVKELTAEDERFAQFMGETDAGIRVMPTRARALQLYASLVQVGRQVEVDDPENPNMKIVVWQGGYHDNIVKNGREGQAEQLAKLLTVEDMNLVAWMRKWYEQNRKGLSDVSEALFGVGVYAETGNYMPVKMLLDPQGLEKPGGAAFALFPKALTPRVKNERDFDTSADILSMWGARMDEAAQWKAHAELGLELRGIFGRAELQKAIAASHGAKAKNDILAFVTDILAGHGNADSSADGAKSFVDSVRGWAALGALGGNVGVMLKQTTSIPAFGFEIGMMNTAKHLATAFTPEGFAAMRTIWGSEERRNRWTGGNTEAVTNALNDKNPGAIKRLLIASMVTNKFGDSVPGLVVGQGIYRDALERGMSAEDAMAYTWMLIERTQQSSRVENRSAFQRRGKLGNMIYQFLTTQQQYLQYELRALREVVADPKNAKKWGGFLRAAALNHFVLSSAYYWMGELYKSLLGQEPPEDRLADWVVGMLTGPYGALYGVGLTTADALKMWIYGPGSTYGRSGTSIPSLQWLETVAAKDPARIVRDTFDGAKTWDDVLDDLGKWLGDFNATYRDLSKLYRFRVKDEPQRRR